MMPFPDAEPEEVIRIPIGMPATLHEWLREASHKRRVSMAEVVREAIREYRERMDPQLELPITRGAAGTNRDEQMFDSLRDAPQHG